MGFFFVFDIIRTPQDMYWLPLCVTFLSGPFQGIKGQFLVMAVKCHKYFRIFFGLASKKKNNTEFLGDRNGSGTRFNNFPNNMISGIIGNLSRAPQFSASLNKTAKKKYGVYET